MHAPMTVARRLLIGFGVLMLLLAGISAFAWSALRSSDAAMKTIYEDRTVPMGQLGDMRYLVARNRVVLMDAAGREDANLTAKRLDEYRKNLALSASRWKDYMATYLTPEEAQLAKQQEMSLNAYIHEALDPTAAALARGEYAEARKLLANQVSQLAPAAQQGIQDLIGLQVRVAKETYQEASAANAKHLVMVLVLGVVAGVIAAFATVLITRKIVSQLGAEPHELADVANRIAGGDLRSSAADRQRAPQGSVMASMQAMRHTLNDLVLAVRVGVDHVATASGQIAQGNQDLSNRTEEQASSLQQTAASMEQLSDTIQNTAGNAGNGQRMAQASAHKAQLTGAAMGEVVETFAGIQAASQRISEITGVIDGIAFQTNILALNAAVEAARAGDSGRGFAVVAGEVRLLAQRSAEAAREIKALIADSVEKVETGSAQVADAGRTMDAIVKQVQQVAALSTDIDRASSSQRDGIEQVGGAMGQVDSLTQQNAALVEESAAAAESLKGQAVQLAEVVHRFKLPT